MITRIRFEEDKNGKKVNNRIETWQKWNAKVENRLATNLAKYYNRILKFYDQLPFN